MERRGHDAAAADRRRHDQPPAHGREDRARLRRAGRARARRLARGQRGRAAARPRQRADVRREEPRRAGAAARAARQQDGNSRCCRYSRGASGASRSSTCVPTSCRRRSSPGARLLEDFRLARSRSTSTGRSSSRAWELRGKFPRIFEHPSVRRGGARAVRRRPGDCSSSIIDEQLLTRTRVYGFWPAQQRRRRHRAVHRRTRASASRSRFNMLRQQSANAEGEPCAVARRLRGAARERAASTTSARSRSRRHRRRRAGAELRARPRRLQRDHGQGAGRSPGRGVRRAAARARAARVGLRPSENLSHRGADRREVPRHPPGLRLPRVPRPHREAQALPPARAPRTRR